MANFKELFKVAEPNFVKTINYDGMSAEEVLDAYKLWISQRDSEFLAEIKTYKVHNTTVHNMPCCVEADKKAIFWKIDENTGVFLPSLSAQSNGWHLVRAKSALQKLALSMFF